MADEWTLDPSPEQDGWHLDPTPDQADFLRNPLTEPHKKGPLTSALEGKTVDQANADTELERSSRKIASEVAGAPSGEDVPSYLGHGLESGLYAAAGMAGDIGEALNPVSAARDLWLRTKDIGNQLIHAGKAAASGDIGEAVLGADKESAARTAAGMAASTPFTRFAEKMQRESMALAQTPDGQKYNDLVYATTDPSKSALLSPVRLIHDFLQSLPSTVAMATTVYLTRGAAAKAYSEALAAGFSRTEATAIATKAAGRVAMVYGAAGEGAVGGLQQAEQTRVQALDASNPEKSPIYQAMVKAGVSEADAKQYVATEAANVAGLGAGAVDALTNALEGPILGRIISEGGPLVSRVFKGFAAEGTQEAVQGAGEQVSQNFGEKQYLDPGQKLADGVAENVISSFAVGGITGGMFAGVGGQAAHPAPLGIREGAVANAAQPTPEDEASPLPTDLITHGKATMAAATATGDANQVLDAAGMPGVGTRVSVTHNGKTQKGAVADAWTLDIAGQTSTGIKIRLDDGSMIEEPIDTLRDMGVSILPEGLPATDLADPEIRKFAEQGMKTVEAAQNAAPVETQGWSLDGAKTAESASGAATGANLPQDVVSELKKAGIPEHVARAVAAGTVAEAGGNARALNPTSGAMGLGQWLGSRKDALIARYGPNPTRAQQIEFLIHELKGGDAGGAAVLSAKTEEAALEAYVRKFMRPAAGAETDNDIKRGRAALGLGGVQRDMFGGREVSGVEMDAKAAVDRADQNEETDKEELLDHAHAVLESEAANDPQYVDYHGKALGAALDTTLSAEEAPTYARAVVDRFGKRAEIEEQADQVAEPTDAQKEAGNYKKGHINLHGLDITIETPKGATRSGVSPNGKRWSVEMPDHYGYVKRTTGADGEQVDVYVGPKPESQRVFLIDQHEHDTGKFDEHKAMLGYDTLEEATAAYDAAFNDGKGPDRRQNITEMSVAEFRGWLSEEQTAPAADTAEPGWKVSREIRDELDAKDVNREENSVAERIDAINAAPEGPDIGTADEPARQLMADALAHMEGGGRSREAHVWDRSSRIAALAGAKAIGRIHVAEALSYERAWLHRPSKQDAMKTKMAAKKEGAAEPLPGKPRVFVNHVGPDGKTDAERGQPLTEAERQQHREESAKPAPLSKQEQLKVKQKGKKPETDSEQPSTSDSQIATDAATDNKRLAEAEPVVASSEAAAGEQLSARPATYGASNRIFTVAAADKARATIRSKFSQLNSGVDPELLSAGMTLAGYHIEAGARKFADFAKAMIDDLGDKARPFLRAWYEGIRHYPGADELARDMSGPEDIGAALATLPESGKEAVDANSGNTPEGPAGSRPGAVQSVEPQRAAGGVGESAASASEGNLRPSDSGSGEATERSGARSESQGGGRGTGPSSRDGRSDGRGSASASGQNYVIEPGSLEEARGPKQKARDNLDAIRIVKQLSSEGRLATVDEQHAIARYVGWGGIKNVFPDQDGRYGKGFEDVGAELKELLTPEEYETARRSIQYAHYTAERVVREIWRGAQRLGFDQGQVLEPGMGTGNFAGMMPAELRANRVDYQGIEFDGVTYQIAKALYPRWGVQHGDYTATEVGKDAYRLAIGNPPFSETVVKGDPAYRSLGLVLHDYFFAKTLDAVQPGGALAFVTSAGTMNKMGTTAREYLAERAWLAGAIRLPGTAFAENAGTEVTTDIIFLVKKVPGEERPAWAFGDHWTKTGIVELPNKEGGKTQGHVNHYFLEHPEMVLGTAGMFDKLYPERYGVRADGRDLSKALAEAIDKLPEGAMRRHDEVNPNTARDATERDFAVAEAKNGSFYLKDGELYQKRDGIGVKVETKGKGSREGLNEKDQAVVRNLIPIRDGLRDVYAADLAVAEGRGDAAVAEKARKALNKSYDAFVARHGPINKGLFSARRPNRVQVESARRRAREEARAAGHEWDDGTFDPSDLYDSGGKVADVARIRAEMREAYAAQNQPWHEGTFSDEDVPDTIVEKRPNIDPFKEDPENYRLRSIEHYDDETGTAKKGRVFFESVIAREEEPDIKNATDALFHVLNRHAKVDLEQIAHLAGTSPADAATDLAGQIFLNPDSKDWEHSAVYLAGNVREKLARAREALKSDHRYQSNVDALEAVMPLDLGKAEVRAVLGMPWIPASDVEQFVTEELGLTQFKASYASRLATWAVSGDKHSAASTSTYGTGRRSAVELMGDGLNGATPKIFDTWRGADGSTHSVLNTQETQAAQDKLAEIKGKFEDWLFKDDARAERLLKLYNERFNSFVAPEWNGDYLTTPGVTSSWKWRAHQKRGIARIVQSGNTYLAHAVGAGKTATMIAGVMEMRRLGLVSKPMIAVPNHMLGQFTKEWYELYPLAKLMVADEENFHTDKRKQFISDVALNDLDAVIITHSAFGLIPMSSAFEQGFFRDQLNDLRSILNEVKASDEDDQTKRITRRKIEQSIEQAEQRLKATTTRRRDQTFTFEEMGVDHVTVDEAHLFRKLDFATRRGNIKGIDPNGSMRSMDLYMKTRYLEQRRPGRSHVLASGTPITNTMAELFTVSRYLQPDELEARGVDRFDSWASAFGDTKAELEPTAAGTYKMQTRFSEFVNVPELSVMVRQVMDVVTSEQLSEYVVRPKVHRELLNIPQTPGQQAYQRRLAARMKAIEQRTGKPQKGDDIILTVIGDGRKSAIDMRLVDPSNPPEQTKLEALVENVHKVWVETKKHPFYEITPTGYSAQPASHGPATQMVFSSLGVSEAMEFNVHRYIKSELAKRGVPKDQVVLFNQIKSTVAKQKVFNDMNTGKVRILIGSVDKMGTGVNAQKRLYANHNLDPEWLPSSDEQRNGRINRQGNTNREIRIYDYATKGTYDSQMWGIMARKAKFIEGFFRGDPTLRTIEDLGEASLYEQAKALTTKDPRILELTEAKLELEKEIRRRNAHDQETATATRKAVGYKAEKEAQQARLELERADAAKIEDIKGDAFKAVVDGKSFDDRGEFQEALDKRMGAENLKRGLTRVGKLGGFDLALVVSEAERISFDSEDGTAQKTLSVEPVLLLTQDPDAVEARYTGLSKTNTAVSAQAALEKMRGRPASTLDYVGRLEKQQNEFAERAKGATEYAGLAKIAELDAKVKRITKELEHENAKAEEAKHGAQPQAQQGPETITLHREDLQTIFDRLMRRLAELGVEDKVSLEVGYRLRGMIKNAQGQYESWQRLIKVALDKAHEPLRTLDHETIHALRDPSVGAFTEEEWSVLSDAAWADDRLRVWAQTSEAYKDLPLDKQREEAAAEYFSEFAGTLRGESFEGRPLAWWERPIFRALLRIGKLLHALNHAVSYLRTGKRAPLSPFEVVIAIDSGKIGRRGNTGTVRGKPIEVTFGKKLTQKAQAQASESAAWTKDRIAALLRKYAVSHDETKTKSYVAWVAPGEFVKATTPLAEEAKVADRAGVLNKEKLADATPEPFLIVEDAGDGFYRIVGHEGRHRMAALEAAGVAKVSVVINERGIGWSDLEPKSSAVLFAQRYGNVNGSRNLVLDNLIPLSFANKERLATEFGQPAGVMFQAAEGPNAALFPAGIEERWNDAAKGIGDGGNMLTRMNLAASRIGQAFSRHWINLPNVPKYAELQQELRKLEAAPQAAKERAVRHLRGVLKGLTRADMDLFARKVVTDDLAWEADSEHDLPFGFTPETLADARKAVEAELQGKPHVVEAVRRRKALNRSIAEELVAAGVLDAERLKNPNYYRHVVLDYARAEAAAARTPGMGKKLRSPRWAKRLGSEKDINANYLEAEFDWLAKALVDIPTAKAIGWIGDSSHNILPPLREQAKRHNKAEIDKLLEAEREEYGDEGGPLADALRGFKRSIAMGFKFVEDALESNHIDVPPQLQRSFDALSSPAGDPFPFLSWMLDNNQPGANGAAVILKAISQRRVFTARALGRNYIDPTDAETLVKKLAPEGYATWSPDDARLLFTVKTMPEHAIDAMLNKIDAAPGVSSDDVRAMLESARSALSFGGMRYAMVLPQEVADTLNQLRREDFRGLIDAVAEAPLRAWKRWVLINPRRVLKYNLNNLSGDLDAVIAGSPRVLRHVGTAALDLAKVMTGKAEPSARYEEAVERGVFDSGLSIQEIPDIKRLSAFADLTEGVSLRPDKVARRVLSRTWGALQGGTQWRENVLRYAAYLDYVQRLETGEEMSKVGYGASLPKMVDAVQDPRDKAALLARDLLGDYGNVSYAGQEIRRKLIPFWSWMEINTKRYWRLSSNAFGQGIGKGLATSGFLGAMAGTRTTVWLGLRMALFFGLMELWNHLLFGDEEDKLDEEQRRQLHLIIGTTDDGQVQTVRLQGALSDAVSWFGLSDAADALRDYELGRGPWYDVLLAPAKATTNKLLTAVSPVLSVPFESISGKKLFPDVFATRFIRDKWRNLASTFSVENEYDLLLDKPSRGYGQSWLQSLVYSRDPGEIAYNEARGLAYDWLKRTKGQDGGVFRSDRSDALYEWRAARKFGDPEAERKAIDRLIELGVTDKDLKQSIKRASPLGPIAKKDRKEFLAQLTDDELETFARADAFYRQRFLEGPQ